jgi:hypothetical protein
VVGNGISVTVIVLIESQPPVVEGTVSVIEPGALKMCPSKAYGNWFAQTAKFTVVVGNGSIVTVVVQVTVSQSVMAVQVTVEVPTL